MEITIAVWLGVVVAIMEAMSSSHARDLMSLEPGTEIEGTARIGNRQVPLPDGRWETALLNGFPHRVVAGGAGPTETPSDILSERRRAGCGSGAECPKRDKGTIAEPGRSVDPFGQKSLLPGAGAFEMAQAGDPGGKSGGVRVVASGRAPRPCSYWLSDRLRAYFRKAEPDDIPLCVRLGAKLETRDGKGRTPLHIAARYARDPDMLSRLVEAGADIAARTTDDDARTALHIAARHNPSVEAVARLIELGADVNARDRRDVMPLHLAALYNRNPAVTGLLIDRGADLDALAWDRPRKCRHSVWSLAQFNRSLRGTEVYRRIRDHARRRTASVANACPTRSAQGAQGKRRADKQARARARLCEAWSKGHLRWTFKRATAADVENCLNMGTGVTIRDLRGENALHVAAAITGDPDVVVRLVEAGADVMARTEDRTRNTPLHIAASRNSNAAVVARLIDLGADVNARNADRWQPLHMAARASRNPEIPALLIERGADRTSTADYRGAGSVRKVTLLDLARGNRAVHNSDWYRELEAEDRQRRAAEAAKRLAELEKRRKERERLAEEARTRHRERVAKREAGIARERKSCKPAMQDVGVIGSWQKQSPVIADLNDLNARPPDAYGNTIPFLLAGIGKHGKVEQAFAARLGKDIERWSRVGVDRTSGAVTAWIGVAALLRKNCFHEIADFIVVTVVSRAVRNFGAVAFRETGATHPGVHPDAIGALEHVPRSVLAAVSAKGRMSRLPPILEAAFEALGEPFVTSCVDYYNAQFELNKGHSLTSVQRNAFTEVCKCFHDEAGPQGYLWGKPKFTDVMADLIDPRRMFSAGNADIMRVLGRCSALHGQSLK